MLGSWAVVWASELFGGAVALGGAWGVVVAGAVGGWRKWQVQLVELGGGLGLP